MMGPGYGYGPMTDPGYGYGPMMGPGYGHRGRTEQGYGYGHMMGPGYGHMMGPEYGYGHMGFYMMDMMRDELNLTDKQAEQLYDLGAKYRQKYFENRGNIDELNQLEQQHRKEIENILKPDQKDIFNKYKRGFDRYGWYGGCPYH